MAVNVTYLLGAGASFDIVPLVREVKLAGTTIPGISQDILNLSNKLKVRKEHLSSEDNSFLDKMVKDFLEVGTQARFFSSPDTYARSLFLKGGQREMTSRLKRVLSFYLAWKQLNNLNAVDRRYIPFLAGILDEQEDIRIPNNIKILSWNYDFQLELALRHFKPMMSDLADIQDHFKILPATKETTQPSIVHLNGVSGMFKDHRGKYFNPCERKEHISEEDFLLKQAIEDFKVWSTRGHDIDDLLSFAWEIDAYPRIQEAVRIMMKTEILVVVGYSFPFFNREIDRKLIQNFFDSCQSTPRIYIQDPAFGQDQVTFFKERFKTNNAIITPINSVDQFFLPPEL